jgi:hypothetical protein
MGKLRAVVLAPIVVLTLASVSYAQQTVVLPDSSQTTTMTANVSEQARVTVPATVTFNVTNVLASTAASAASVTVSNIVLANATDQFEISLQANTASFDPPVAGAITWSASDVSWNAASWTNAAGSAATLSSSAFNTVATCTADTADCSTSALVFTLGAKGTVQRSGDHVIVVTWKFENIGT